MLRFPLPAPGIVTRSVFSYCEVRRIHLLRTQVNSLHRKQALGFVEWDDRCEDVKVCTKGVTPPWPKWSLPKTP